MKRNILLFLIMILLGNTAVEAQKFFNLTANDVRIGDDMPVFKYSARLGKAYADSTYTVSIDYPEFIDMSRQDIEKTKTIVAGKLPEMPLIHQNICVERKQGILEVYFNPIVFRNGKYQKLVSFMLNVKAKAKSKRILRAEAAEGTSKADRYAKNSVLASGKWAKIRIPSTGVYQLTDALVKRAGFTDLSKVKIYGYGGGLHKEELEESSIMGYDDLKEVPTCTVNGKRLFYGIGTVTWSSKFATTRTRNPYSDYGYYFLTQGDDEPAAVDSAAFIGSFYPSNDDYHSLHEIDNYAWYEGGRNLYESTPINAGATSTYTLTAPASDNGTSGRMMINITSATDASAEILFNDSVVGNLYMSKSKDDSYSHALQSSGSYMVSNIQGSNTVAVRNTGSSVIRLDFISLTFNEPRPEPKLSTTTFPEPEYVYNITNQNHHADKACDMIIIVPTSQKLTPQAERLKAYHEKHDKMSVRIVPADELYNEFSSGTPEADAYRLYLKMLYDRAETDGEMPKYLVLFGDCVWDNRMNTSATSMFSPDDYLLCFESENSMHAINCFVDEGYFVALDDGEGANASSNGSKTDKYDMAVGRFPVTTVDAAKIMVDKTINYMDNIYPGEWQNKVMFLGDDGNNNVHMKASNNAAKIIEELAPGLQVKRIFWDMYPVTVTATGNTYPEITEIIKKQQNDGVLLVDYCGHGRADQMSHEAVLRSGDFSDFKNKGLSLWITASCDIMPFDGTVTNIGENAVLNPDGGAVAFYGTTRTVYTNYNEAINRAYLTALFTKQNGKYTSIGEAQRIAKNNLVTVSTGGDKTENKLQYNLLGDPALVLNVPGDTIVVDSINGISIAEAKTVPQMKAGSRAIVKGHVKNGTTGEVNTDFTGIVNINVMDSKEDITGRVNDTGKDGTSEPMTYQDRINTIFNGNDSIRAGKFEIQFAVTKDINYSNDSGLITVFAINDKKDKTANGYSDSFIVGGTEDLTTDSIGPSIYCYLNSPSFVNGGNVNSTPYFVANLSDDNGLNTSGSGIGHELQLVIDDDPMKTYSLNDNFSLDFGSFTKGSTYYNIPELEEGTHRLKFTAWDILNNPSTATLKFNVVKGLTPKLTDISCSNNPAKTNTTFIVAHDRGGSDIDVSIEVFDASGRLLWTHKENGVASGITYTYNWDLCTDVGGRLQSGVYLYRVRMSCDGSSEVSKAKKLIVLN